MDGNLMNGSVLHGRNFNECIRFVLTEFKWADPFCIAEKTLFKKGAHIRLDTVMLTDVIGLKRANRTGESTRV